MSAFSANSNASQSSAATDPASKILPLSRIARQDRRARSAAQSEHAKAIIRHFNHDNTSNYSNTRDEESFFLADFGELDRQIRRWTRCLPNVEPFYGTWWDENQGQPHGSEYCADIQDDRLQLSNVTMMLCYYES